MTKQTKRKITKKQGIKIANKIIELIPQIANNISFILYKSKIRSNADETRSECEKNILSFIKEYTKLPSFVSYLQATKKQEYIVQANQILESIKNHSNVIFSDALFKEQLSKFVAQINSSLSDKLIDVRQDDSEEEATNMEIVVEPKETNMEIVVEPKETPVQHFKKRMLEQIEQKKKETTSVVNPAETTETTTKTTVTSKIISIPLKKRKIDPEDQRLEVEPPRPEVDVVVAEIIDTTASPESQPYTKEIEKTDNGKTQGPIIEKTADEIKGTIDHIKALKALIKKMNSLQRNINSLPPSEKTKIEEEQLTLQGTISDLEKYFAKLKENSPILDQALVKEIETYTFSRQFLRSDQKDIIYKEIIADIMESETTSTVTTTSTSEVIDIPNTVSTTSTTQVIDIPNTTSPGMDTDTNLIQQLTNNQGLSYDEFVANYGEQKIKAHLTINNQEKHRRKYVLYNEHLARSTAGESTAISKVLDGSRTITLKNFFQSKGKVAVHAGTKIEFNPEANPTLSSECKLISARMFIKPNKDKTRTFTTQLMDRNTPNIKLVHFKAGDDLTEMYMSQEEFKQVFPYLVTTIYTADSTENNKKVITDINDMYKIELSPEHHESSRYRDKYPAIFEKVTPSISFKDDIFKDYKHEQNFSYEKVEGQFVKDKVKYLYLLLRKKESDKVKSKLITINSIENGIMKCSLGRQGGNPYLYQSIVYLNINLLHDLPKEIKDKLVASKSTEIKIPIWVFNLCRINAIKAKILMAAGKGLREQGIEARMQTLTKKPRESSRDQVVVRKTMIDSIAEALKSMGIATAPATTPTAVTELTTLTAVTELTTLTAVTELTTPTAVTHLTTPTAVTQLATPTAVTQLTTPTAVPALTPATTQNILQPSIQPLFFNHPTINLFHHFKKATEILANLENVLVSTNTIAIINLLRIKIAEFVQGIRSINVTTVSDEKWQLLIEAKQILQPLNKYPALNQRLNLLVDELLFKRKLNNYFIKLQKAKPKIVGQQVKMHVQFGMQNRSPGEFEAIVNDMKNDAELLNGIRKLNEEAPTSPILTSLNILLFPHTVSDLLSSEKPLNNLQG